MRRRSILLLGSSIPLLMLSACGGDSGVASTPPPPAPAPTPPPPPPPTGTFNTAEDNQSNAAVQAQALVAYQAGATGKGVTAAVIDSGINLSSAEFTGKISALSADLAGSRGLQDEGGHGSAVSGVLLGARNGIGMHGVAFDATLLVARTDTPGSCTGGADPGCSHNDNNIARGVDLAVTAGVRVINMSLGGSPANSTLRAAINRATNAGIIIVISAGNEGVTNPANAQNPDLLAQIASDPVAHGLVLIAGASDSNQVIADFSNRAGNGAAHYLTALGVRVRSNDNTGAAFLYSGTSFSAPVVAGAVALLAQAFPTLSGAQIVDLLLRTATDLGATGVDAIYGHGELNLARAFAPQGTLSLAGSTAVVSLTDNGTLSAPMGDAGQSGMAVGIRDSYARDYNLDLSQTLGRAPQALHLAPALTDHRQHLNVRGGATTIALSVAESTPGQLLLGHQDYRQARALAGSVATRIGSNTSFALGFATGSAGLDHSLASDRAPAFLVSETAQGIAAAPQGAFAVRQRLGGIGVTLAAESGDLAIWQRGDVPRADRYRYFGYGSVTLGADAQVGPLAMAARLSRLTERETVLGAQFGSALGGGGATSWFADARATLIPLENWQLGAKFRHGWTLVPAGLARGSSTIQSQALALYLSRSLLLASGDSLAFRWSEPLRVTSGGINLAGAGLIGLAPTGHERDLEGVYARALGDGSLTLNGYWRQQPGNFAAAPDDLGMAMRYSLGF